MFSPDIKKQSLTPNHLFEPISPIQKNLSLLPPKPPSILKKKKPHISTKALFQTISAIKKVEKDVHVKKMQFREQIITELDSKVKVATMNAREWVIKMIYDDFLDPIIREATLNFSDPDYSLQLQNSIIKLLNSLIYCFTHYSKNLKNEVRSFL